MISRSLDDHLPSSSTAPHPLQRNLAPHMHPFAKPREYTRALNAAKIDRMFAKPFVSALGGHQDGVYVLGADPRRASVVAAGGGDGEVIVHSLSQRRALLKLDAHKGMVGGLCWTAEARDGKRGLITAGKLDGQIKIWRSQAFAPGMTVEEEEEESMLDSAGAVGEDGFDEDDLAMDDKATTRGQNLEPSLVINSKNGFNSLDHHRSDGVFATASSCVQIWDETRTAPLSTLSFGGSMETVACVRFNQSETSVLASVGNERTMCLYDVRTGKAERRIVMNMRSNQLSWCPTLPTVMLLASEDHNLYTYDLRNLERPTQIYKGHVGGVMGCDWSKFRDLLTGHCQYELIHRPYRRRIRLWKLRPHRPTLGPRCRQEPRRVPHEAHAAVSTDERGGCERSDWTRASRKVEEEPPLSSAMASMVMLFQARTAYRITDLLPNPEEHALGVNDPPMFHPRHPLLLRPTTKRRKGQRSPRYSVLVTLPHPSHLRSIG